jgi:hypothetical protein
MTNNNENKTDIQYPLGVEFDSELDTPQGPLGITRRQAYDWEARHRKFCALTHRQPCNCSAWD